MAPKEIGESSSPPQDKQVSTTAIENVPAALLCDRGLEKHLLRLPAGDLIHPLESNTGTLRQDDGQLIGSVNGGWLIHYKTYFRPEVIVSGYEDQFLCYNCISFQDPVAGAKINLPPEPSFIPREDFVPRFVANVVTSDSSPDAPDFIVVAFFLNSNRHWLAFCKIQEESWIHISEITHACTAGIAVQLALALDDRKRLLYFVHVNSSSSNYDVMAFDINSKKKTRRKIMMADHPDKIVPREGIITREVDKIGRTIVNLNNAEKRVFLAADSSAGELFMIFQTNDMAVLQQGMNYDLLPTKSYRIFKLEDDGSNGVGARGGPRWKEIDDLGSRTIFISYLGSKVVYTEKLNAGLESGNSVRENCIYFALQTTYANQASLRRDIGAFSLTDKSIRHFNLHPLFQRQPSATLWFNPK